MKTFRWLFALSFVFLSLGVGSPASAQTGEPTISASYDGRLLSPNRASGVTLTVTNTTDTPIILYGVEMSSLQGSEACPAHWFGDAGYPDRPRGESETQPPVPPYPLPSVTLAEPVQLAPGEAFTAPMLEIWMIQAAPNSCQRARIFPSYSANWEFVNVQAYATISGAITDSVSGAPIGDAAVTITGTTDNGVESETVSAVDGIYASTLQFHADTDVTVAATAAGYEATSGNVTVGEGANTLNLTMAALPPAAVGVSGTVTDAISGEPIPGATVTLTGTGADGAPLTVTLTADNQGAWASDAEFAVGSEVTITATATGYSSESATVTTGPEGVSGVDLELAAQPIETPTEPVPSETPGTETPTPSETPGTETPVPTEVPTETVVPTETIAPTSQTTPVPDPAETPGTGNSTSPVTALPETGTGAQSSNIFLPLAVMTILALGTITIRFARRD